MYFMWTTPCFKAFRVPNIAVICGCWNCISETQVETPSALWFVEKQPCRINWQEIPTLSTHAIVGWNHFLKKTISFIFLLPEALKGLWLKLLSFAGGKFSSCYYFLSFHLASFWNSSKLHGLPHSWFLDFMSPCFSVFFFSLSNSKNKT